MTESGHVTRVRRRLASAMVALAVLGTSPSARAATDEERAGARAAAIEGARAYSEQRWNDVIDLFTRAESLVHSPVHLLYMARAQVQIGKLVLANELYMKVIREKVGPDSPAAFAKAQESAQAELQTLQPRICYATTVVEGAGSDPVAVMMDGVVMPAALVGVPRPVDPGEHKFEAYARGLAAAPVTISIAEGSRERVALKLAPSDAPPPIPLGGSTPAGQPIEATQQQAAAPAPGSEPAPSQDQDRPKGTSTLRIASYAAFGVGAVGLIGGVVFKLKGFSKRSDADALCDPECPKSKQEDIDQLDADANSANSIGTIGLIVGGVGAAAGATLFVLSSGTEQKATARPGVRPWVGLGSAGVSGRF